MESLSILIGSGVSYYSDIPNINNITNIVLSGHNIIRESDSHYHFNNQNNKFLQDSTKKYIINNVKLCIELNATIDEFFSHMNHDHECNYEDIYFVNRQICDSYLFEYENPAIIKLIKYLKQKFNIDDEELREISIETAKYIECIVWRSINTSINKFNQFKIIYQLIESLNLKSIISLNHDLVLEKYLKNSDINYDDGFIIQNRVLPEWIGFSENNRTIKLLKVHGSVDWFSVLLDNSDKRSTIMKLPKGFYAERLYEIHNSLDIATGRPELLIGTFNKMWGYLHGIFEEQYFAFKNYLLDTDILIISGYGFGDKAINTKLHNWLVDKQSKMMIIIHPNKLNLVSQSRGIFPLGFMSMIGQHPKISFIEKKFEDVTTEELYNFI